MIRIEVNQQIGQKIFLSQWQKWVRKIETTLKLKKNWEISLALVGKAAIKKLNSHYRGKNRVTDVLSFSESDSLDKKSAQFCRGFLGEIIICYPQAKKQAKQHQQTLEKELQVLLNHGFLHLLGYDHEQSEKKAKEMQELERRLLA